jgi:hypothetical protein
LNCQDKISAAVAGIDAIAKLKMLGNNQLYLKIFTPYE